MKYGIIDSAGYLLAELQVTKTTVKVKETGDYSDELHYNIEDYNNGLGDKTLLESIRLTPWMPQENGFKNKKHPLGRKAMWDSQGKSQTNLWKLLEDRRGTKTIKNIPERWFNKAMDIKVNKPRTQFKALARQIGKWSNGMVSVNAAQLQSQYDEYIGNES